ncbi:unnamed protein product, partial [Pylaiella littoralis]
GLYRFLGWCVPLFWRCRSTPSGTVHRLSAPQPVFLINQRSHLIARTFKVRPPRRASGLVGWWWEEFTLVARYKHVLDLRVITHFSTVTNQSSYGTCMGTARHLSHSPPTAMATPQLPQAQLILLCVGRRCVRYLLRYGSSRRGVQLSWGGSLRVTSSAIT